MAMLIPKPKGCNFDVYETEGVCKFDGAESNNYV